MRYFLRPDSASQVRWITLVTGATSSVRLTLNAIGKHVFTVPARAPDRTPDSVLAESRRPEHIVANRGLRGRVVRDRLWVQFRPTATREQRQAAVDAVDGVVIGGQRLGFDNLYYLQIPVPGSSDASSLVRAIKLLRSIPQVRYVIYDDLDAVRPTYRKPQDGGGFTSWQTNPALAQGTNWATQDIAAPMAWGCSTGDSTIGVALVDNGFFPVSDLAPNVDPNSQLTGRPGVDHGTRTSSIIGAVGNNQQGITGMMWRARLGLYYMYQPDSLAPNATWYPLYTIRNAARAGYRIINVSEGLYWTANGGSPPNVTSGADSLSARNIGNALQLIMDDIEMTAPSNPRPLIVLSASNDGVDAFWSGYATAKLDSAGQIAPNYASRLMVVAATQQATSATNRLASYSDRGPLVDVAAPGSQVAVLDQNGAIAIDDGASFAAPHASGVAGLLLSFDPRLSTDSLRALILRGATNGGRVANDPSNASRPIPVANAYESLKAAAGHLGAPLCGNQVWAQNGTVWASRGDSANPSSEALGTFTTSQVPTAPYRVPFIAVEHGGRQIGACINTGPTIPSGPADVALTCNGLLAFGGGQWTSSGQSGYATASGTALSGFGLSHERDTLLTAAVVADASTGGQYRIVVSRLTGGTTTRIATITPPALGGSHQVNPLSPSPSYLTAFTPNAGSGSGVDVVHPMFGTRPSYGANVAYPSGGDTAVVAASAGGGGGTDFWGVPLRGGSPVLLWHASQSAVPTLAMTEDGTLVGAAMYDGSSTCALQYWSLSRRAALGVSISVAGAGAGCAPPGGGFAPSRAPQLLLRR